LVRRLDLQGARKLLGQALGKCPKKKIFKFYIDLELQLGEIDRCRRIYERQIQVFAFGTESWTKYALFESGLGERARARQIFELAIS
jgi:crooked neck